MQHAANLAFLDSHPGVVDCPDTFDDVLGSTNYLYRQFVQVSSFLVVLLTFNRNVANCDLVLGVRFELETLFID